MEREGHVEKHGDAMLDKQHLLVASSLAHPSWDRTAQMSNISIPDASSRMQVE
jgi:hypothetical protein